MTFEKKRDTCVLFMRQLARLHDEAADKILVCTSPEQVDAIADEFMSKAEELEVMDFE